MADSKKYSYSARDLSGEIKSGVITADSETAVAKRLQNMGLAPISIKATSGRTNRSFGPPKKIKAKHLGAFCRQFATMAESGLPLVRSLAALAEQSDHPELQRVLPLVRAEIEGGQSFSVALSHYPKVFPPLMASMVSAGEASGSLSATMERIADQYEKEARLKSKVFSAMLYPVAVLVIAIVMIIAMLLFVVPAFTSVFSNLGGELPLPTKMLVLASDAMKILAVPLFIAFGVFSWWWRKNKHNPKIRNVLDPIILKVPIFGPFIKKIALARFCRTFGGLLESGVPMLQCIDMVADTTGNVVLTKALHNVKEAVRAGRPLAAPMAQETVFPSMVTQMIGTGEETGNIAGMLGKVADYYDVEIDMTADSLTAILEPIMIVGLAGIVGGMVVAMYLPMFKVFELIK